MSVIDILLAPATYYQELNLEQAKVDFGGIVYIIGLFFERLEGQGKVGCNGHHQAQKLSEIAQKMLEEVWVK